MLNPHYVTGLVEGEGCFCVSFSPRKLKDLEWEVRPSFSLSQNKKDRSLLFQLRDYFGCGAVRPSRKDNTYKYEVRSLKDLADKIIPHFQKYPLQGEKKKDFQTLAEVVRLMQKEAHLTPQGLKKIARILEAASPRGKRIYDLKRFYELVKV